MPAFVVDSAALSRNIEKLRRFTSAQIIAVVKGNGYGLGMVPYARFLPAQGVALLAVSTAAEAAALLQALPALRVEGVFTHLSDAANAKCTALQYRRFTEGVRVLQEAGIDTGLRHVCASTAFLRYPEMHLDAVRLGSALLGRLSVPDTLGLERIGWLEAQVTELKTLPAGWPVGYTGAYCPRRETRLALLPVGYASGGGVTEETNARRLRERLRRVLHAGRRLLRADGLTGLVNGCRCPVRGVVGATAIEADVTGVPCAVGDTARIEVRPKFVDSAVPREYR